MTPDPSKLLYHSNSLLLYPSKGSRGTISYYLKQSKTSKALNIPFISFDQNALCYVIYTAVNEPQRGPWHSKKDRSTITSSNKHNLLLTLSPEHHITKSWLMYFRAIIRKQNQKEIASSIEIVPNLWQRWESPLSHILPSPQWTTYLWRWWEKSLKYYSNKSHNPVAFSEIITPSERVELIKQWRPRYFYQLQLKKGL